MEQDELLPDETEQPKIRRKTIVIAVSVLAVLFVIGYYVYSCMLGYAAHSRYETLCVQAQIIYAAAEAWEQQGNSLTTHISKFKTEGNYFSFFLQGYCDYDGWYAIVCDAEGNLDYVLYSREKIKEKRMQKPDRDEEMKRLRSPVWHTYAIGCYPEEP